MGCFHVIHRNVTQMVDGKSEPFHLDDTLQVNVAPKLQILLHSEELVFILLIDIVRD